MVTISLSFIGVTKKKLRVREFKTFDTKLVLKSELTILQREIRRGTLEQQYKDISKMKTLVVKNERVTTNIEINEVRAASIKE